MTIQDLFHIDLPIIQSPMAGVQGSALALAVCSAGGLGSLPCAALDLDTLRAELETLRDGTAGPVNINFFCHTPPAPDAAREAAWRNALAPYYREFGIDLEDVAPPSLRAPFGAEAADLLEAFKPAVVSFHFGLPSPELVARVKSWGTKILASATTLKEALWLQAHGVDAVIAQGLEAGGHRGHFLSHDLTEQMGTLALLPQIVRAVKVPVIAAGGIADANGVSAALSLGAAGVQIGTAYLLCPETQTSTVHRIALKHVARHTALTNLFTGRPARGIMNRIMRELGPMSDDAPRFPNASAALAPLRAKAESEGSGDFSPLWSGQNATGCKEISASDLTRELTSKI